MQQVPNHRYRMIIWDGSPEAHAALRTKSQFVEGTPAAKSFAHAVAVGRDLLSILQTNIGRMGGLAANQVGIHRQVMVLPRLGIIINPKYYSQTAAKLRRTIEGCYSLPTAWYETERPDAIWAAWTDAGGHRMSQALVDNEARIFMHELDHLRGKLLIDHALRTIPHGEVEKSVMILPEGWE